MVLNCQPLGIVILNKEGLKLLEVGTPVFSDIHRNIDLMGFDFLSFPLTIPLYQLLFPDEIKNSFLFLLSLSVSISEVELHIQLLRCWPGVPLLQLPAALLCVQQQPLSESQSSSAGFSLPATGPNSQSKIVQNAVLSPCCSSSYTSCSSSGYFILT